MGGEHSFWWNHTFGVNVGHLFGAIQPTQKITSRVEAGSIGRAFEGEKKLCEPGPKSLGYLEIGSRPLRLSV